MNKYGIDVQSSLLDSDIVADVSTDHSNFKVWFNVEYCDIDFDVTYSGTYGYETIRESYDPIAEASIKIARIFVSAADNTEFFIPMDSFTPDFLKELTLAIEKNIEENFLEQYLVDSRERAYEAAMSRSNCA